MKRTFLFLLIFTVFCGAAAAESAPQKPAIQNVPITMLTVDGYQIIYADLLPPNIRFSVPEDTPDADLLFSIQLGEEEDQTFPLFTMTLDADVGDWVVVKTDAGGRVIPAAFHLAPLPEDLTDEQSAAFVQARDEIHVLLATLQVITSPDPTQLTITDEENFVCITTQEYELTYSSQLANVLFAREAGDGSLEFYITLAEGDATVFTIVYGSDAGDIVIMPQDSAGVPTPVSFLMASPPSGMNAEDASAFYMAQDAAFQIMNTLTLQNP